MRNSPIIAKTGPSRHVHKEMGSLLVIIYTAAPPSNQSFDHRPSLPFFSFGERENFKISTSFLGSGSHPDGTAPFCLCHRLGVIYLYAA